MYKLHSVSIALKFILFSVNNLKNIHTVRCSHQYFYNCKLTNTHNFNNFNNFNIKLFSSTLERNNKDADKLIPSNYNPEKITNIPIATDIVINSTEPEDYRTIYIENLPKEWTEAEIKVRLEQIGPVSKLHLIKDSIGIKAGKVLAVFQKVEHGVQAIDLFKDKMPSDLPVKIRFFRETLKNRKQNGQNDSSPVLVIKNLPDDLRKEDLNLFISQFKQPIHISYPRDHENEFKKMAFVYFLSNDDAEYVLKYANLRYVKNKQLYFQFSFNHYDITDFRTRIELGIKLDPSQELIMYQKQISEYKLSIKIGSKQRNDKLKAQDNAKLEYLTMKKRKFEFALGITSVKRETNLELENDGNKCNEKRLEAASTKKFLKNSDKVVYNQDKSIVFYNSQKYIKKE